MSLILDALRKMEQDRNSRRGAAHDLRPEVLRYRRAPAVERRFPLRWVSLGVVLLVAGLGAGYLVTGGLGARRHAAMPVSAAPVEQAPAAAAPATPVPVPQPAANLPAPAPVANSKAAPQPVRPPFAAGLKEVPGAASEAPGEARSVAPERPIPSVRRERPAPAASQAVQQTVPTGGGDITVSGIAWQDERNLRRAVLNGNLVGEGAQVAGARVVEIREDRVRLSRNGQVFDVLLSSAAR
ncbi:hypothetical protein GMLC_07210 [Geomonas limicola]|uniref:Uncharacterized protein n=1 Tax=Geomonas limicola TaxID=2740186 RepID=A0A6V8N3M0_9BACT|nr:hypothetical protein [Geomonas limicola]GFO67142.1 hypothetical protein GMLC_07210 [Geomonas limicola]